MAAETQIQFKASELAKFARPRDLTKFTAEILRPPRRMKPVDAITKYLRNDKGSWDPDLSTMFHEPANLLASREYQGVIVIGPARSSKTYTLILGGITYVITCA